MKKIGGIFGRSPLGPLREHMSKVNDSKNLLPVLVEAFINGDLKKAKKISQQIAKLERDADEIKGSIREALTKSIFSSISRAEIMTLLKEQDSISDACEDVAKFLSVRQTAFDPVLKRLLLDLVHKVTECVSYIDEASRKLVDVEESASRNTVERILVLIESAHRMEFEADQIQLKFVKELFKAEGKLDPVSVVFLMILSRDLGSIADHAENTGECIRRIILK